jgi:hypothetical protein
VHTDGVNAREWWSVILTALAAPVGSISLGIGLARWADATTGGMAVLAGGVVGLWVGAPLAAFLVFVVCVLTLMRHSPMRRWLALLVMLAGAVAEAVFVLIGLRLVGGSTSPELGLVVVAVLAIGLLGGSALVAVSVSRRRIVDGAAD